jgi:hypothetical protein
MRKIWEANEFSLDTGLIVDNGVYMFQVNLRYGSTYSDLSRIYRLIVQNRV